MGHEVSEGEYINGRKVNKSQAEKYNSFYKRAFESGEVEEILERAGGSNLSNFREVSKEVMQQKLYWDAMFNPRKTFKGRDGIVRPSKFQGTLGSVVYAMLPKDERIKFVKWTRKDKEYTRPTVAKGKQIKFNNKTYRAGSFLPKGFL